MSQFHLPREFPFWDASLPYSVRPMRSSDIDQIMQIERTAFPAPWPASAYRYELTENDLSLYFVLELARSTSEGQLRRVMRLWRQTRPSPILAYGGFWGILDEAHISTIAVHPDWRGRGLGEMVLVAMIDAAILREAAEITLEVRVSNTVAQNLYRKYAFNTVGRRKRYYHDNNEDAWIMTTPRVDGVDFRVMYTGLKSKLRNAMEQQVLPALEP